LERRLSHHNKGYSTYTKKYRPWKLIWYQELETRKEAYQTEQHLKKLKSRLRIVKHIENNGVKVIGAEK
jgi:putative endonuclease